MQKNTLIELVKAHSYMSTLLYLRWRTGSFRWRVDWGFENESPQTLKERTTFGPGSLRPSPTETSLKHLKRDPLMVQEVYALHQPRPL